VVKEARAIFLDRDGVINHAIVRNGKPHSPSSLQELKICSGVVSACRDLKRAGYLLIIATNQPDVARGLQTRPMVEKINEAIRLIVPIDDVMVCYHDDSDNCGCRKPKPGLLLRAASERGINLAASFMIGDRCKDIVAGLSAGCTTVLIKTEYETATERAHITVPSLRSAADWILGRGAPYSNIGEQQPET
jgi:D-glycero-D-manno-heptose 1,7-bisphosphate phosphatase